MMIRIIRLPKFILIFFITLTALNSSLGGRKWNREGNTTKGASSDAYNYYTAMEMMGPYQDRLYSPNHPIPMRAPMAMPNPMAMAPYHMGNFGQMPGMNTQNMQTSMQYNPYQVF